MHKTHKYRIYPSKSQVRKLDAILAECCWLWNHFLHVRKNVWETEQKTLSWYDTNKMLPGLKCVRLSLKQVHSQTLQDVTKRLDLAYKAFFRRVKQGKNPGFPHFKRSKDFSSFTYPTSPPGGGYKFLPNGKLYLSKVGNVKIKLHRPLPSIPRQCTIRRSATNKWYACFVVEITSTSLPPLNSQAIGIDLGLESFATLSDGTKIDNPRFFRNDERKLAQAQRKLNQVERGTPEYTKAVKAIAHIHEHIVHKRTDFAHKLSRQLVARYGIIVYENLCTANMLRNHCLAKSISDAAWNQLVRYTLYKAKESNVRCILVSPRNTSKACSHCGAIVGKSLSDRTHSCPYCGLVIDRDLNAAINILRRGLASLGGNP